MTIAICHDSTMTDDYPWFIKEDGEQVGQVLDIEASDATDDELIAALRNEFPTSYGKLADTDITIIR